MAPENVIQHKKYWSHHTKSFELNFVFTYPPAREILPKGAGYEVWALGGNQNFSWTEKSSYCALRCLLVGDETKKWHSTHKNMLLTRLVIVINWAVSIGPKFKNESFKFLLQLTRCSWTGSPASLDWNHILLRKDLGPWAAVGMRIEADYISNLQETEKLQIHIGIWV